jgi:enterochelin esterase family protein
VCGLSSGGFGAWHLATRRPDVFGFASMLSADTLFDVTHLAWVYRAYEAALPGPPSGPIPGNWDSWLTYGLASCYSPNPDAPFFVDLPLDHPGGRLRGDVWERWLAYDPCVNVSARSAAVRRLHGIRLDVGRRDEYGFLWGHRSLAASLREIGVEPREVEHDGTHVSHLMQSVAETVRWFAGDG